MKHLKQKISLIRRGDSSGFTLFEILIIIVIIGILMGVILVGLVSVKERASRNALMKTMGAVVRAAGACEHINYVGVLAPGQTICIPEISGVTYPALDFKLTNNGYSYGWSGVDGDLIGEKDHVTIITCYVESGSCEET